MKYLLKLGFQNISRAKTRTILTFMILAFGVAFYIFFVCLLSGFDQSSTKNMVDFETGHFKIRSAEFDEDTPLEVSNFIQNPAEVEKKLQSLDFVTGTTPRLSFMAELDNYIVSTPVMVWGIDQETDSEVFTLTNYIQGDGLREGGAIIGKSLAEDMNIAVNDYVYLTLRSEQGMVVSVGVVVDGLINAPSPEVNNATVIVTLEDAKSFLNTESVSEIAVRTEDFMKFRQYEPQIEETLPGYQVYSWRELGEDYFAVSETKESFISVFILFIVIIALVGIINTMLMSVFEKKREIGTLKALGMKDRDINTLFMMEGIMLGTFGAIAGMALGALINVFFAWKGMDVTAIVGDDMDIGYKVMGAVKSVWLVEPFIKGFVVSVIASAVASYFPARRATRLQPMECLRVTQ